MPPQGIQYRASHNIQDEALLGMVMTESRPPRPNSIELRRSYPSEDHQLYSPPISDQYRAGSYTGQSFDDSTYGSHYAPGQGQSGSETYQSPSGPGTPSRGGRLRPSQPPPAPPSNASSSNSTPTIASANNTPTRGRSMSTGRDTLPPPPPPPGETMSPPAMNGK